MEWGALLIAITDVVGKFLDIQKVKLLRKHSDKVTELELALHTVRNKVSYDDHDDLYEADLVQQIKINKDAFFRDLQLMGQNAG